MGSEVGRSWWLKDGDCLGGCATPVWEIEIVGAGWIFVGLKMVNSSED